VGMICTTRQQIEISQIKYTSPAQSHLFVSSELLIDVRCPSKAQVGQICRSC